MTSPDDLVLQISICLNRPPGEGLVNRPEYVPTHGLSADPSPSDKATKAESNYRPAFTDSESVAMAHTRARDRSQAARGHINLIEIPVGTVLTARPRVNQNVHSVQLEVRCCRPTREGYLIGCQFLQTPPWNVLMLFG